jgi:transposase
MTIVEAASGITGGVDTHLDKHVAAALDPLGRLVGTESFNADAGGYKALLVWLESFGQVTKVGIEGTGSYGVGLSRFLRRKGVGVVEVNRPNRQARRNQGKSDPLDARAAISSRASGAGKTKDGPVEAIRVLVVAKRFARQARVKAIVQMRHLGITAPDQLHSRLRGLSVTALVGEAAKLRTTRSPDPVTRPPRHRSPRWLTASRVSIRSSPTWTRRSSLFSGHGTRPPRPLRSRSRHRGNAAGGRRRQPERLHSEAAWARLCGVSPVPADSGKNGGHLRRHDGGDPGQQRPVAYRHGPDRSRPGKTTHYFDRRVKEGRTQRDVIRILKRYVAREVYRAWAQPVSASSSSSFSHGLSQPNVSRGRPLSLRSISWRYTPP